MKLVPKVQPLTRRQFLAHLAVGVATVTAVPVPNVLSTNTSNPKSDRIEQPAEGQSVTARPFVLTF